MNNARAMLLNDKTELENQACDINVPAMLIKGKEIFNRVDFIPILVTLALNTMFDNAK